ncbi:uncharacterized protein J7T54_003116 [Emericellopsis cladophorae]|uniref:Uncharacterized protein n=1 Tax=Emericellopsis cladophorae TaxID=2686198 RepID=A0A9P9Y105_9HYPO|nr:uncharacterized protein J7T54_003116 [Emericellopsis cladophorae]KAI6780974.1 hypothetical protein J7T54_003116 [Emericellopsis cladophorae]
MARDSQHDAGASSASAQSRSSSAQQQQRPPLPRQESDSTTESHQRHKHHHVHKQHKVTGRPHARVASSKALHAKARPHNEGAPQRPTTHRRATSEVKLTSSRNNSSANLVKNVSQSSLKRNRSHGDVKHSRNKSSDKIKRLSSGSAGAQAQQEQPQQRHKSSKSTVHFDLGSDDDEEDSGAGEEEWVDASGSNSPHMSRKGSLNSSAQSSVRPGNSRPQTPSEPSPLASRPQDTGRAPSVAVQQHQQYLTSRLLQRTPSTGAPPMMTNDSAGAAPSISPQDPESMRTILGSGKEGLTSRFVDDPSTPGITTQGSFYHTQERQHDALPERPKSMANLSRSAEENRQVDRGSDSALVPTPARRSALPAETSRIQQKLNLQRASTAIEPSVQHTTASVGTPILTDPRSRDFRMGKLLEKTGMEYLVVRRYQNPIARSLARLSQLDRAKRIPTRPNTATGPNGKQRPMELQLPLRHSRNVSMPVVGGAPPATPTASIRTTKTTVGSSFGEERLSGSSAVEGDDGTTAALRGLWEKSAELVGSGD